MFSTATLSELPAFGIGHAQDDDAGTGCTVIVAPEGATCAVDVRGGGPATRETDLLKPENMIEAVHAVVLSGGSAFGLEASCGVMDVLSQQRIGFDLGSACVPIVTGTCLFDLLVGRPAHPDKAMGALAAQRALANWEALRGGKELPRPLAMGNVGAGCGATVGKLSLPARAMKSGFGYACLRKGDVAAAALIAVNSLGCVRDERGRWIAGCLGDDGQVMDPYEAMEEGSALQAGENGDGAGAPCTNTAIGTVLTNAKITKAQAQKVASTAHDAYARMIEPVHTSNDGDTIFAFASGEAGPQATDTVAILATKAMERAIVAAVSSAKGAFGLKSASDIGR